MLEAELALSSRVRLQAWVQRTVNDSLSVTQLLNTFLSLICTKEKWKYSEAWVCNLEPPPPQCQAPEKLHQNGAHKDSLNTHCAIEGISGTNDLGIIEGPGSRLRLGVAVIPSLGNTDDPDLRAKLERFRDKSRSYGVTTRVDLPGRIICTMRPEWLPTLQDNDVFQRSQLAQDATLVVCFGVPLFVRGQVIAVATFFDTEQRPYDPKSVNLAENVASMLGAAYGNALEAASRRGEHTISPLS